MKLHQLRDFVAVATSGSLRAAARRLGLTQPSITKSIQQLEKELGHPLFERHVRGARLTIAGQAFQPRAEAVLSELHRAAAEIRQLEGRGGQVHMALSAAVTLTALPEAMMAFRLRYPEASVRIVSGTFTVMFQELRAGHLDFSLGTRPVEAMSDEFRVEQLFHNPRVVLCRQGHPLRHARSLADLVEAEWLVAGATGLAAAEHDQIFLGLGLPVPRSVVQCEYPTASMALLARTDSLAIMPHQYATTEPLRRLLEVVPIREPLPQADIVLISRADMPLTPAAAHMLMLLRRQVEYSMRSPPAPLAPSRPRKA